MCHSMKSSGSVSNYAHSYGDPSVKAGCRKGYLGALLYCIRTGCRQG